MVCFHSRYKLGDEHDYKQPEDFLRELAEKTVSPKAICDYVAAGHGGTVRLAQEGGELIVTAHYFKEWEAVGTFKAPLAGQEDAVADMLLDYMDTDGLLNLAKTESVMLPLFLYDHSGLAMSTGDFNDRWDSGQVGWTYITKAEAAVELQIPDGDVESKATELLEGEVKEYDSYLQGECYGFQLYQNGTEVDSCWGFIGRPEALRADIESYLPDDCKGVMDSIEYLNSDAEVEMLLSEQERNNDYLEGENDLSATEISMEARAYPFTEPKGNQLGFASVTLNGGFALTGIKIVQGQNGPFVSMPSTKDREGNYRDIFFPTTKELREKLNGVVLDAHNKAIDKMLSDRAGKETPEERPSAAGKLDAAKKEAGAKAPKGPKAPAKGKGKGGDAI
jgi:DNA-binding cell septation regulator SpoVG